MLKAHNSTIFYSALLVLGILAIVLYGTTLADYPLPTCDEVTYAGVASTFRETGRFALSGYSAGEPVFRHQNALLFSRPISLLTALSFSALGERLMSARLVSLLAWAASLPLVYILMNRLSGGNKPLSIGTVLMYGTSQKTLYAAHIARPEAWLTVGYLVAMLLAYIALQSKQSRYSQIAIVGVGAFAVGLLDIHSNGILLGASLALGVFIVLCIRREWKSVSMLIAGGLIGLGFLVVSRAIPDGVTTEQLIQVPLLRGYVWRSLYSDLVAGGTVIDVPDFRRFHTFFEWLASIYIYSGGPMSLLEAGLGMAGVAWGFRTKHTIVRLLVSTNVLSLLGFAVLFPIRWYSYGILWSPLWYMLGLLAVYEYFFVRWQISHQWLLRGLLTLIAANIVIDVWLVNRSDSSTFTTTGETLTEIIPPGSTVVGDPIWWWQLHEEHNYITDEYLAKTRFASIPPYTLLYGVDADATHRERIDGAMSQLGNVDYVLLDDGLACRLGSTPQSEAFTAWVDQHCSQIETLGEHEGGEIHQLNQALEVYTCK